MVHQCSAERGTARQCREKERERERQPASIIQLTLPCLCSRAHTSTRPLSRSLYLSCSHFLTHTLSHTGTQGCRGSAVRSSTKQHCLSRMSFVFLNQNWSFSYCQQSQTILSINPPGNKLHRPACPPNLHWWAAMIEAGKVMWGSVASPLVFASTCCRTSQLFFQADTETLSHLVRWVIMPQRLPGGSVWQTLIHWIQGQTNQLSQTAATPLPSNHRSGNQVQKGIKRGLFGLSWVFFIYQGMWRTAAQHVQYDCPLWLTEALHSVMGKEREEEQGPKQICFLQHGCLATTAAPYLCLEPSLPLQRDPLCNPNWELILHSGCLTLRTPQHHTQ